MQKRENGNQAVFPGRYWPGNFSESEGDKKDNGQGDQHDSNNRFAGKFSSHRRTDRIKTQFRKRVLILQRESLQQGSVFWIGKVFGFNDITILARRLQQHRAKIESV